MIKVKKLKLLTVVLAIVMCLGFYHVSVRAEEKSSLGFTVSPMSQRILLTPGEEYKGSISISSPNDSTTDLNYTIGVGSFGQRRANDNSDDYGDVDLSTSTTYNQIKDWITIEKDSGIVAPNETDVVPFVINVPKDVPAGGQYATIIVKNDTKGVHEDEGESSSIKNIMYIASIIYAEVAGETREEGQITNNSVPSFLLNGPLEAVSMVRNNGNVHTDAEYTLQVWPLFSDEEICTNEEKPDTSLILPETERYHAQTCDLPAVGIFRAKQTVKIFGETSIVEKTVIICPIWLLFIIIFVIIAIIIWIVMRIRARNKSDNAKRKAEMEK